ncbi:hypothetical protein [Pendulispora albinea]|uniref:Transporter n=1 Tax=Pendulispora albinea TaxID=2741071 RepID=A0ABZ2M4D6_9BACT
MRRSRPFVLPFVLGSFAAAFAPSAAHARCDNPLTNTCIDSDTLWPHAGPSRFVGVGGTETVAPGHIGFGLVTSYLSRPIVLHLPTPGPTGTDVNAVDNQVNATFLFAYGLTKRLELDAAMPLTLVQSGSGVSGITAGEPLRDTARRDLRFGLTYAIVPRESPAPSRDSGTSRDKGGDAREVRPWSLAGRFVVSAPTGDTGQFAGDKGAVFVPSLAADLRLGRFFGGVELGARLRQTSEFVGARIGTQGYAALGAGFDILPRELLSVSGEGRVLPIFTEQHGLVQRGAFLGSEPNGKHIVPAEWTAALRSAPFAQADVAFQIGGGGAIPFGDDAVTTPRFRFTLGIVYAPRAPRAASSSTTPTAPAQHAASASMFPMMR